MENQLLESLRAKPNDIAPKPPPAPQNRILYESDDGNPKTSCPICGSSLHKMWGDGLFSMIFDFREKGCVNTRCSNYWKNL